MIALRDFTHEGRDYIRSERFEVAPITAAILRRSHDARLTTREDGVPPLHVAAITPEPEPEPVSVVRRRRSRRRDMSASVTK